MPPPPNSDKTSARRAAGLATLGLAGTIAILSLMPVEGVPAPDVSDKVRHFAAYATLAAPLALFLGPRRWWLAALIAGVYGAGLEVAQAVMPFGREGSLGDVAANLGGAVMGAGFVRLFWRGGR